MIECADVVAVVMKLCSVVCSVHTDNADQATTGNTSWWERQVVHPRLGMWHKLNLCLTACSGSWKCNHAPCAGLSGSTVISNEFCVSCKLIN